MPFRRPYKKKRTFKRRKVVRYKKQPTPNKPGVFNFKRSVTQVLQLSNVTTPTGWTAEGNAIYKNFSFTLNELNDATDFTNLFKMYKLNAVKTTLILGNTQSSQDNSQLLVYWDVNVTGQAYTLNEQVFLDSQTSRHMVVKPPSKGINMYCKLKQLSNTFKLTDDDYAIVKPRWISTEEPNTPHYGIQMRIQRVDDRPMGTDIDHFQYMKIFHTIYFQTKKVH